MPYSNRGAILEMLRKIASIGLVLLVLAAFAAEYAGISGLVSPESVVAAPDGRVFVSQIGEFGKDGDGSVAAVDIRGRNAGGEFTVFAKGMDDPKGIDLWNGTLYVADKTKIWRVDGQGVAGVWIKESDFPRKPLFLNDVAIDRQGNLYVSDSGEIMEGRGKGVIYRVSQDGEVARIIGEEDDPAIKNPNGLLADGDDHLLVLDFTTGALLRIALKTKAVEKLADGFGGGDGIARDRAGMLYLSDWKGGKLWKYDYAQKGAKPQPYPASFQAAADIALDPEQRYILVPDMKAGRLVPVAK
jgi:sugar lactone lactonase YvrE